MAGVICPSCGTTNTDTEVLCSACGYDLSEAGAPPQTPSQPEPASQADPPDTCPTCGADVPDPANLVCVECLAELTPRARPTSSPLTRHESGVSALLRLLFPGQAVGVPLAGTVLLGRDAEQSPFAALFADRDNISRRHASVGVRPDGAAWVRDEYSTNGTFVNDVQVPSGGTVPLADGDVVRIASDVTAQVELNRIGRSTSGARSDMEPL